MLIPILLFLLGLGCLIKGGDWFVDGAVAVAKRFHVPDLLLGATVVSIGTTLPEVMVSASSAVTGHGEIAYGNAIGSIICNTALIAAITLTFRPGAVDRKTLRTPVLFFAGASVLYAAVAYATGSFTRIVGILLLLIFAIYLFVTIRQARAGTLPAPEPESPADGETPEKGEIEPPVWKAVLFLVVGAALIAVGAHLLVENGTVIARELGVPESVIALTFVALGTSLPELTTAVVSLIKGHGALSLGNVIGANLFNLVLVSGLSTTLNPFDIPLEKQLFGKNASLVLDLPLVFLTMGLLVVPALWKQKLYRWQGIVLLILYFAFCTVQFFF